MIYWEKVSNFARQNAKCLKMQRKAEENQNRHLGLHQTEATAYLDGEVLVIENLRDVARQATLKTDFNTIVNCSKGKILVEVGNNRQITMHAGQLLLIPANKLIQPMLVSTDVEGRALLVSDSLLRSVLGAEMSIWNQAMYVENTHVIDGWWNQALSEFSERLTGTPYKKFIMHTEIMKTFLRLLFLIICEELSRQSNSETADISTGHDKSVFNDFLKLIYRQSIKRQKVAYYAEQLCVTPKYLSAVCKRVSGKSPIKWITESVMDDIYVLLKETDLSIKQISERLGFPNQSFFGQYFREQTGMTPGEYRKKDKKG